MSFEQSFADFQMRWANVFHKGILAVSGGRLGNRLGSMQVVELHTTGRKSGKRRSTMLTSPIVEDGTYVLVASKGGDDRDPDWYRNLVDDPQIDLTVDGVTTPMMARVVDADEKAELWDRIVATYGGYGKYQAKTDRDIPVIVCEPAED